MKKTRKSKNKKIKTEIVFDDSNPTFEESKELILQFFGILMSMQRNQILDTKSIIKEERKEYELLIEEEENLILKILDENFEEIFPATKNLPRKNDRKEEFD